MIYGLKLSAKYSRRGPTPERVAMSSIQSHRANVDVLSEQTFTDRISMLRENRIYFSSTADNKNHGQNWFLKSSIIKNLK